MQDINQAKKTKLLVYIPCHKDYEMAFKTAEKISNQFLSLLDESSLELQIQISINNVDEIQNLRKIPFTHVSHMQSLLGGDSNIAKGFVSALEIQPDYFWILSANEGLVDGAIKNLSEILIANPTSDLIVANAAGRLGKLNLTNVFLDTPPQLALGLISGVIYKFSSTKDSFMQSTVLGWTGWGHLGVIQNFLTNSNASNLLEIPDSLLYAKPYTFSLEASPDESERELVRKLYLHSFFGLPALAFCLLQNDTKSLRRFQSEWLKLNWYKVSLFSKQKAFGDEIFSQRVGWIKSISTLSFNQFLHLRILYFFSSKLPTNWFSSNQIANRVLNFYKSKRSS